VLWRKSKCKIWTRRSPKQASFTKIWSLLTRKINLWGQSNPCFRASKAGLRRVKKASMACAKWSRSFTSATHLRVARSWSRVSDASIKLQRLSRQSTRLSSRTEQCSPTWLPSTETQTYRAVWMEQIRTRLCHKKLKKRKLVTLCSRRSIWLRRKWSKFTERVNALSSMERKSKRRHRSTLRTIACSSSPSLRNWSTSSRLTARDSTRRRKSKTSPMVSFIQEE